MTGSGVPSVADAVVIGAGAFGLSVAYFLAREGAGRVVVLDRYAPGSQTSPRAAGLFKLIQGDELRTRLAQLAIETVLGFSEETGVHLPVERSGSLLVARTEAHAAMIHREAEQSRRWGVDLELIDAVEAQRLAPYLEPEGILAACFIPGDVYIEEPASLLTAYQEAAKCGVAIFGYTPVTGIRVRDGEVTGVTIPGGEIATPVVVDAAGAWARQVGRLAGASVPVVPMRHQLYITQPIAGMEPSYPIVRIIDAAVYVRPARGGIMLGGFESSPLPLDPAERGESFSMDDVPLDFAVLEQLTGLVDHNVPALRQAGVQEHRGGLFTMTADGIFLVGPVPGVRGLWALTGCNGSGFSFSPALGRLLAEWIVHGEPSLDIRALSPGRFSRQLSEDDLVAAAVWQYAHYYSPEGPELEA
uniref:FAD-binding oxidoreductase n=1 Tax=Thermorudis sp. TaxID=1969470 RepID=A0A7C2WEB4_9BACT